MHQLVQKIVRLHAGEETVALREQELLAYVKARAEFLWEGWVRQENRWEFVPLVALAWHWLDRVPITGYVWQIKCSARFETLGISPKPSR